MDALAGDPSGPDPAIEAHGAGCERCQRDVREVKSSWAVFNDRPVIEPPRVLEMRTRKMVLAVIERESLEGVRGGWREVALAPLAIVSAVLVAGATLALLGGVVFASSLPSGHMFFCAAIYTGLLVGAFSWLYGATTVDGVHLDAAARMGVLALAITVAATTACPELHVLTWWDRSVAGQWLTWLLGAGGSSLVFGFGYGLIPAFLGALLGGRLMTERPIVNALVAVAVVFVLVVPLIYLQSAPFSSGVITIWLAGTAIGTMCGVCGALTVRQRVSFGVAR